MERTLWIRDLRTMFRFERGLCPRNRLLGEASEGVVETPSDVRTSWSRSRRSVPSPPRCR